MAKRLLVAVLWIGSLFLVGGLVRAQSPQVAPGTPTVLTGSDIGFRLDNPESGQPTGTLVVRIDGRWVEPRFTTRVRPLTK